MSMYAWLLVLFALFRSFDSTMDLILFPKDTSGTQCLDGSAAGFYYEPPQHGDSNLWVIFLEGGGACFTQTGCESRANSSLGSSTFWSTTMDGNIYRNGVLSSNSSINPDFYNGHHVFSPYCSGDVWSGQRKKPSKHPNTWGYYFSGHLIFQHILLYLSQHLNLLNASNILLTGNSAGGYGTFANIDYFVEELRWLGGNNNAIIKAAPSAGWFCPDNTTDQLNNPLMPPNDYPHWIKHENGGFEHNDSLNVLWDAYLNPKCEEALKITKDSWHCFSVGVMYTYIETPLFVMQNKYDSHQMMDQFLLPNPNDQVNNNTTAYVEYFGIDADRSILSKIVYSNQLKNGLFYASCFDHGNGLGIGNNLEFIIVDGYNSSQLVGDWFWERNEVPHIIYDQCNSENNQLPCNPSCDGYPTKTFNIKSQDIKHT